jgi:hypothetical protein
VFLQYFVNYLTVRVFLMFTYFKPPLSGESTPCTFKTYKIKYKNVVEPHDFEAAPAPDKNFDAASQLFDIRAGAIFCTKFV